MHLRTTYYQIIGQFDADKKRTGKVNILYVTDFGLSKVDTSTSLPEVYRRVIDQHNYIEATWTYRDGNRTFKSVPDRNTVVIRLIINGALDDSKSYSFLDDM